MATPKPTEWEKLQEIQTVLNEAYDHRINHGATFNKSAEGHIAVDFGCQSDRWANDDDDPQYTGPRFISEPKIHAITIFAYDLGPSRRHTFRTLDDALTTVKYWRDMAVGSTYDRWGYIVDEPDLKDPNLYVD